MIGGQRTDYKWQRQCLLAGGTWDLIFYKEQQREVWKTKKAVFNWKEKQVKPALL